MQVHVDKKSAAAASMDTASPHMSPQHFLVALSKETATLTAFQMETSTSPSASGPRVSSSTKSISSLIDLPMETIQSEALQRAHVEDDDDLNVSDTLLQQDLSNISLIKEINNKNGGHGS